MPTRRQLITNPDITDELDDEQLSQFKREQVAIVELKDKVKNGIFNELVACIDNTLDKLVDKIIDDFDDDDTKNVMFVSTTHDYPCSKCSNNSSKDSITSMSKILSEKKNFILGEVGEFITKTITTEETTEETAEEIVGEILNEMIEKIVNNEVE